MDLMALDVSARPALVEGEWVAIDYDLCDAAHVSQMSQYELVTGLGTRFDRKWQ